MSCHSNRVQVRVTVWPIPWQPKHYMLTLLWSEKRKLRHTLFKTGVLLRAGIVLGMYLQKLNIVDTFYGWFCFRWSDNVTTNQSTIRRLINRTKPLNRVYGDCVLRNTIQCVRTSNAMQWMNVKHKFKKWFVKYTFPPRASQGLIDGASVSVAAALAGFLHAFS